MKIPECLVGIRKWLWGNYLLKRMLFFFILGKNVRLSRAELSSYFERKQIESTLVCETAEAVIFDMTGLDPLHVYFLDELGGALKAGIVLGQGEFPVISLEVQMLLMQRAVSFHTIEKGKEKFTFGFSGYGLGDKKALHSLGISIKKSISAEGVKCRFVTSREQTLSSVVVAKNRLVEKSGMEVVFLKAPTPRITYFGRTIAVQDFESYALRDFGKPARNPRAGMLPPKLAQMMINLAQAPRNGSILDPFCGTGTILMEAYLMGYTNLWGSDISDQAVGATRKNLEWLVFNKRIKKVNLKQVFVYDAGGISSQIKPQSISAIVTEPFLGPPLRGNESREKLSGIIDSLTEMYASALSEFKKILTKNGRLVMVWPVFRYGGERLFLPLEVKMQELGFRRVGARHGVPLRGSTSERTDFVYAREGQKLEREIWVFEGV